MIKALTLISDSSKDKRCFLIDLELYEKNLLEDFDG
jgi:hypothetical protein